VCRAGRGPSPGATSKCCSCARALQLQENGQPRRSFQVLPVRQGPAAAGNWSAPAQLPSVARAPGPCSCRKLVNVSINHANTCSVFSPDRALASGHAISSQLAAGHRGFCTGERERSMVVRDAAEEARDLGWPCSLDMRHA